MWGEAAMEEGSGVVEGDDDASPGWKVRNRLGGSSIHPQLQRRSPSSGSREATLAGGGV